MRGPLFLAPLALVAGGTALATAPIAQKLGEPLPPRTPEQVYSSTCAYCHGANVGPVIRGRALPAAMVEMTVRQGRNAMPAFRPSEISPAELHGLAQWIEASPADPKEKGQ
ncbi:c-type cytochrome [Novosphingobium sp.]|uniref:c-type cytochrome n=1 Tax=Novosphingobium sp. TaxID=1874826 RepID=UPI0038BB0D16